MKKTGTDGMVTMLNELSRYAAVTEFSVKVEDEEGRPVSRSRGFFPGAELCGIFLPVAEGVTGEDGTCSFTTGLGSLAVQISRDGQCECVFADTREQKQIRVIFGKNAGQKDVWEAVDMIAPVDSANTDMPTAEQTEGNIRLEKAAARRTAKTEAWVNPECEKFLQDAYRREHRG